MRVINCQVFFSVLQAAQNRGLLGRLVRGVTPMVTYPATAVCGGVVSGVALATSPVRGTFLVAKWAGKGLLDYASLTETRQEAASSSGSAAADSSLPTTEDTSAATSSQVSCLCCMQHLAVHPLMGICLCNGACVNCCAGCCIGYCLIMMNSCNDLAVSKPEAGCSTKVHAVSHQHRLVSHSNNGPILSCMQYHTIAMLSWV